MTRFTTFTEYELDMMESAFRDGEFTNLVEEVRAERKLREKAEVERHRVLRDTLERLAMNANYGLVTRSCEDDEKLVVLCMINKTLKDMCETLEGMQETLARIDDKI